MANRALKAIIFESGLKQWEVAEALGWSESGFSRKLRKELPETERSEILSIVKKLKAERKVEQDDSTVSVNQGCL